MSLLYVTPEDIVRLSDDALIELLGRLIDAESAASGIPLSAVIHGGHGSAPDDGVGAWVSWSAGPECTDWFPRRTIAFQSKAESMPAGRLTAEMAPGGQPRALFQELAEKDGAYIVFCGRDNCNHRTLRHRKNAMQAAVSSVTDIGRVALDFYDASRIARWCNTRHGVAVWLRDKLGRPFYGCRLPRSTVP